MKTPTPSKENSSLSATLSRFLSSSTILSARVLSGAVVAAVGAVSMDASALPVNGTVVDGTASIVDTANKTTVTQSTDKAIIHWDSFDTSATETVRFIQPSATSITLNRIGDGVHFSPGFFNGILQSNGKVWIVNPNGMLFGPNSIVKVGSLLVSTANISNDNFNHPTTNADGSKRYNFDQASTNETNAVITINGSNWRTVEGGKDVNNFDTAVKKGDVTILAPGIAMTNSGNKGANVDTHGGSFAVASGQTFTVDFNGDGLVNYSLNSATLPDSATPGQKAAFNTSVANFNSTHAADYEPVQVGQAVDKAINVPTDNTWVKDGLIVPANTPGAVFAGKSNIWAGYNTHINQTDVAANTATVRFIAKVNQDAVMDHVINLGGEFNNFMDYVYHPELPPSPDGGSNYNGNGLKKGDPEDAHIVPMRADSINVVTVVPTQPPVSSPQPTIAPTQPPAPTNAPTLAPTQPPEPTAGPTNAPTLAPTQPPEPTAGPTNAPTLAPTQPPEPTAGPTNAPTLAPTQPPEPTAGPTNAPTLAPTQPPEPTAGPTLAPTQPPEPTQPPVRTPEPTFPPEPTPEPSFPPAPTTAPAPAPTSAPQSFNTPIIDPLDRPLISVSDENGKDTTVDPKHHNVTYERPYLVSLDTSIADGKLTLLAGSNGGVTNLGNLAPAAGGNNPEKLSPSAGGSANNGAVGCANAYLDHEWSKNPEERNCVEEQQQKNKNQPN